MKIFLIVASILLLVQLAGSTKVGIFSASFSCCGRAGCSERCAFSSFLCSHQSFALLAFIVSSHAQTQLRRHLQDLEQEIKTAGNTNNCLTYAYPHPVFRECNATEPTDPLQDWAYDNLFFKSLAKPKMELCLTYNVDVSNATNELVKLDTCETDSSSDRWVRQRWGDNGDQGYNSYFATNKCWKWNAGADRLFLRDCDNLDPDQDFALGIDVQVV